VPPAWRAAPIVHLAPLAREFDGDLVAAFPEARLVGLTPQGWLRTWDDQGRVRRCPWPHPSTALERADAVVLSEEDVEEDWGVLEAYADQTHLLVVTQGARGCTVFESGRRWQVPAYPAREIDATGAGDVFAAAFFLRLLDGGDPVRAAQFANCVASFAVEHVGPGGVPSPDAIEARMRHHPLVASRD
jgi:sugar/nucleoside kinase (ribokinase family)